MLNVQLANAKMTVYFTTITNVFRMMRFVVTHTILVKPPVRIVVRLKEDITFLQEFIMSPGWGIHVRRVNVIVKVILEMTVSAVRLTQMGFLV